MECAVTLQRAEVELQIKNWMQNILSLNHDTYCLKNVYLKCDIHGSGGSL